MKPRTALLIAGTVSIVGTLLALALVTDRDDELADLSPHDLHARLRDLDTIRVPGATRGPSSPRFA